MARGHQRGREPITSDDAADVGFGERAARVVAALGLWAWDWNLATGELWFNPGWERLIGYAPGELPDGPTAFDRLVHPDDKARVLAAVRACLKGETATYDCEHRLRAKDGSWRWFADRARVVERAADGRALRMVGARDDITARRVAEDRLDEQDVFRRLFANTNTAAFWTRDPDGTLAFVDPAVAASFGLPPVLKGFEARRDPIHPDDRADIAAVWNAAEAAQTPFDHEHRMRMADGSYRWVHARAVPMLDAEGRIRRWYGSTNIVHDRKLAEQRLAQREDHLRSILDTVPDAIVVMDEAGTITSFSPGAEAMFGYTAAEVEGRPLRVLMADDMATAHDRGLAAYLRTGRARMVGRSRALEARRKSGEIFPAEIFVGEARLGEARVFSGFVRDISERRRIEARMRELQDELAFAGRTQAMVTMAAAIAHELNQPLAAASNYLAVLGMMAARAPEPAAMGVDLIDAAAQQVLRAGQVLKGLRTFIARGELDRKSEPLGPIVEDARALAFIGPHRRVHTSLSFDGVDAVFVDRVQIQQVLFNLLRNAAEALADHPRPRVAVRARTAPGAKVLIEIADNGPGLPPRRREALFEPLQSSKPEGMGIGLSIARSIVEAHDGRIWADCPPEGGTVFSLLLPTPAASRRRAAA